MTSTPAPGISGLPDEVGGLILALALAVPRDGEGAGGEAGPWRLTVAARVAGVAGVACRQALAALEALPRAERALAVSRLVQRVTAPVPAGIARVHPSWLRAALEGEAAEVLVALTQGLPERVRAVAREIVEGRGEVWQPSSESAREELPVHDPESQPGQASALDELRRAVFSELVAMPDPAEAHADWQRLASSPPAELLAEVARAGAATLGLSLAGAPAAVLARAAAQVGPGVVPSALSPPAPLAEVILAAAGSGPTEVERERARQCVAAAAALGDGTGVSPAQLVGLIRMAERLGAEPPSAVRAVAQRLPRPLGQILLAQHLRLVDMTE